MEKRLPLALFLSFLILIGWRVLHPPQPRPAVDGSPAVLESQPSEVAPAVQVNETAEPWQETLLLGKPGEPGRYRAVFDNRGGLLRELSIAGYYKSARLPPEAQAQPENWVELLRSIDTGTRRTGSMEWRTRKSSESIAPKPLQDVLWEHKVLRDEDGSVRGVEFLHEPGTGVRFRKTIQVRPETLDLEVELGLQNLSSTESGAKQFSFIPAASVPANESDQYYPEPRSVAVWRRSPNDAADLEEYQRNYRGGPGQEALKARGLVSYLGVHGKYFAVLMRSAAADDRSILGGSWQRVHDAGWLQEHPGQDKYAWRSILTEAELELGLPQAGAPESVTRYLVYAGPKSRELLVADNPDHEKLVEHDLGFFSGIAQILLMILGGYHRLTGNWGWAIILLTFSVRAVLFPLNRRSQTAMARHATKMKRVQPLLDAVKARYKSDPKKLQQEQARIMQEEGALPPLGGCLPIFIQIPVFFGLFAALRSNFDLRQAPFMLWMHDLSQPDRLFKIDWSLPLIGNVPYLNVLPPLMVALWIVQQRLMPAPSDPQQARMQKMMMWMPIMMGFFLYNYAAGLSLYMITQSTLGIFEIAVIKRLWPIDTSEKSKARGQGWLSRWAEKQRKQLEELERGKGRPRPAKKRT